MLRYDLAKSGCFSRWPLGHALPSTSRNIRALPGNFLSFSTTWPSRCRYEWSRANPCSAIVAARPRCSARERLPCCRIARSYAANAPGTPMANAPVRLSSGLALPSRKYMSRLAAAGAVSRPSIAANLPFGLRTRMKHPPPMPELKPSTTPKVSAAATTASTALPPRSNAFIAALVARGCTVTAAPVRSAAWPSGSPSRSRMTIRFNMPGGGCFVASNVASRFSALQIWDGFHRGSEIS